MHFRTLTERNSDALFCTESRVCILRENDAIVYYFIGNRSVIGGISIITLRGEPEPVSAANTPAVIGAKLLHIGGLLVKNVLTANERKMRDTDAVFKRNDKFYRAVVGKKTSAEPLVKLLFPPHD